MDNGQEYIVYLADQPYNIRYWDPKFLAVIGIQPGRQALEVEVVLRGRYAELAASMLGTDDIDALQSDPDLDGVFTPSGFSTYPQLVVWNNDAVVCYGVGNECAPD